MPPLLHVGATLGRGSAEIDILPRSTCHCLAHPITDCPVIVAADGKKKLNRMLSPSKSAPRRHSDHVCEWENIHKHTATRRYSFTFHIFFQHFDDIMISSVFYGRVLDFFFALLCQPASQLSANSAINADSRRAGVVREKDDDVELCLGFSLA